jgi:hypothetical protein
VGVIHQITSGAIKASSGNEKQKSHYDQKSISGDFPPLKEIGNFLFWLGISCCPGCLYFLFGPHCRPEIGVPLFLLGLMLIAVSALFLTSLDRPSEYVRVLPVIIAELELGNMERQIFAAQFVECADHAALEDRLLYPAH